MRFALQRNSKTKQRKGMARNREDLLWQSVAVQ